MENSTFADCYFKNKKNMEIFDALFNRRSIRKYTRQEIDKESIIKIIEAGMYAPSAANKQPWHFIVFKEQSTIQSIIDVHPNAAMLKGAAAGILVCFDEKLQHDDGYGVIDCSAATQNMLLAAHGMGIGACWVGIYPRNNRVETLGKLFKLPEHVVPFSVISLGYPGSTPNKPERLKPERINYESWKQ